MPTNTDRRLVPETRTVRALIADGWVLVDKAVIKMGKFSSDWAGFADVIGMRRNQNGFFGTEVILVQATDNTHYANRLDKVRKHPNTRKALECLVRVEIWAWYTNRDEPKIHVIKDSDLVADPATE